MSSRRMFIALLLAVSVLSSCTASPTPDLVATQVAVQRAAAATLTAEQPSPSPTPITPPPLPTTPAALPPTPTLPPPEPSATELAQPSATPSVPPSSTPTPFPQRPDLYAVVDVEPDDVLNVRAEPGVDHPIVGAIPPYGAGIRVGTEAREVGGAPWFAVQVGDLTGWANGNYLARQVGSVDEAIARQANQIIMALKGRDLVALSASAHPDKGIRFSPYTYVRAGAGEMEGQDLVFTAAQIPGLFDDPTTYTWGAFDGSGEPIQLTFSQYYDRFIYDADFARPDLVGFDVTIGQGNTINNIQDVYPAAVTVEYHFAGLDPQYEGLDWRSLRLVLEEKAGAWYLVGIVHDEWTI